MEGGKEGKKEGNKAMVVAEGELLVYTSIGDPAPFHLFIPFHDVIVSSTAFLALSTPSFPVSVPRYLAFG